MKDHQLQFFTLLCLVYRPCITPDTDANCSRKQRIARSCIDNGDSKTSSNEANTAADVPKINRLTTKWAAGDAVNRALTPPDDASNSCRTPLKTFIRHGSSSNKRRPYALLHHPHFGSMQLRYALSFRQAAPRYTHGMQNVLIADQ